LRGENGMSRHCPLMCSWAFYSLLGQHDKLQASVLDFWHYAICLFTYLGMDD
jgi:hypothetical protein